MSNIRNIGSILDSISVTHKFEKKELIFLNTSDVLEGKILVDKYVNVNKLKGQAKKTIKNEDILYSEIRPKNKRFAFVKVLNPEDYVVSTKLMVLRNKTSDVLTKYIYYFLTYDGTLDYLQMQAENRIASFPQITFDLVKILELNVPELSIQKKIVEVLSSLDSKIEINNRINAELEAMAKTLYDFWFVQFDFPDTNGKPYKTSGGKMVWNEELKREIPEGWEVKEIRKFANTSSGGTPLSTKSEYYDNGTIPWINSGELNNPYILSTTNYITKQGLSSSSAKIFSAKTLLVALYGATAGKVSLLLIPACTNQAICAIIPHSEIFTNYLKFGFSDLYKYLINLSSGSARDNLSQDLIKDLKFVVPPNHLLESFDQIITPIIEQISINIKQNQQLSELRDWLLPMLMNGQVTVGDNVENKACYKIEEEMRMAAEPGK